MALSPEDFRQLTQVMQDLTRVSKEQVSIAKGQAPQQGNQPSGFGSSAVASQGIGFASSIALSGFAANGGGKGIGALDSLLNGPGGASPVAVGLRTVGALAAEQGRAFSAGFDNAPLFAGDRRVASQIEFERGNLKGSLFGQAALAIDSAFESRGVQGPAARFFNLTHDTQIKSLAEYQRGREQDKAFRDAVAGMTNDQIGDWYGSFERAGYRTDPDELRANIQMRNRQNAAYLRGKLRVQRMASDASVDLTYDGQ